MPAIPDARKEELLGCDVSRVFDTHLVPLVQGGEGVQRLITAICSGVAVPRLDLPMQSAHGEEEWFTCSSQKMERGPWTGMWVLRMRNITDWKEGSGIRTLHRIFHLIEADDLPLEDLLAEVTRILPPGFRDSGRIGVRIAYGDAVYYIATKDALESHSEPSGGGAGGGMHRGCLPARLSAAPEECLHC